MHPEIHATKPGNCPKCGMKSKRKASTRKKNCKHKISKNSSIRIICNRYTSKLRR
ncbi:heavy metal-binding domain-containing protein [Chryseobacterium mulctrae]|uniref:heavy metal-binding domain-containing protein n=1 Tax=Chryseobacterium mulctrae TaxID=2576777 RepID=UPI001E4CF89C|nr:heavy metal-binding domain-containing protein [Chryseobacterium mulctrae]